MKLPKKHGKGGRNRAFLSAAMQVLCSRNADFCLAAMDTDGIDYERYAGALLDRKACTLVAGKRIDLASYVQRCDSQALFGTLGTHIMTGYTGTNVNDIGVFLTR
jgi:glycerate-2-kinase